MTSEDDPFHDCELDPEAILGTHTFEDVLFTDDTETPVNVLTGETPAHSQATVEEAKEFAASIDTETPPNRAPRIRRVAGRNTEQALHSGRILPLQGDRLAQTPPCLPRRLRVGRVRGRFRGRLRIGRSDHHCRTSGRSLRIRRHEERFSSAGDGCRRSWSEQRPRCVGVSRCSRCIW